MKGIIVAKSGNEVKKVATDDVIRIFENEDNMEAIKESVRAADERIFMGWASVEMKDKAGELIPIKDIINNQKTLLDRNGPISDNHTNKIVGQTLAFKVLEHPKTKTLGVLHLDKLFNDNEVDDSVWSKIATGKTGLSVGGINTELSLGVDPASGENVNVLGGFRHLETGVVDEPCNPLSLNEAFSLAAKGANFKVVAKSNVSKPCEEDEKENVLSKRDSNNCTIEKIGDVKVEDIKKILEDLTAKVDKITLDIEKTKKEDAPEEEKPKEEDKKKVNKEEDPEKPEEEDKKKVKKEDAAGDIDGESDAPQETEPIGEDSNDTSAFVNKRFDKIEKMIVEKFSTPRPKAEEKKEAKEVNKVSDLAMDIAMGKKNLSWNEVHKECKDMEGQ